MDKKQWAALLWLVVLFSPSLWPQAPSGFVAAKGTGFVLDGQPFRFGGANSYDLPFLDPFLMRSTLSDERALGFKVVRTYASLVIGDPAQDADSVWYTAGDFRHGGTHHVYFQRWNASTGKMVINRGPNGLPRLDAVIAAAGRNHIRLVITLVDSWNYTGGAVQYCAWRHLTIVPLPHKRQASCPEFFTDAAVRSDFKTWTRTLLERNNPLTGLAYKDDPTIMTWELANEPMVATDVLASWAADMAAFIHGIDHRHLVSIGNAGFFQTPAEYRQLLQIPGVDYGTLHMYPAYVQPAATPDACIPILKTYLALGVASHKPVVLEEFGWSSVHPDQAAVYQRWTGAVLAAGGAGWQFWEFRGHHRDGTFPPADPSDGFDIFANQSPASRSLSDAALQIERVASPSLPDAR